MLRKAALAIRHAPGIRNADFIWNLLRAPYHRILNFGNNGVKVTVGNRCTVRIPPEFSGATNWEDYEPESVAKFADWILENPNAVILDVGSAFGIFSVTALFASPESSVVAFDGDLPSLKATERVCKLAHGNRLKLVYGLVSEQSEDQYDINRAVQETGSLLGDVTGDISSTSYVCIHGNTDENIPIHSIDKLFSGLDATRPILLKCDVEGAELLVLKGARQTINRLRPFLLLSVHPEALPGYSCKKEDIEVFLREARYSIEVLAIDHEEHWWCEPLE